MPTNRAESLRFMLACISGFGMLSQGVGFFFSGIPLTCSCTHRVFF